MKQSHILLIFVLAFTAFILINPSYIGYTTICSDYTNEIECTQANCLWDSQQCTELSSCSDYLDEFACASDFNCEWDYDLFECSEFTEEVSLLQDKILALQSIQDNPEFIEISQPLNIPTLISNLNDYDSQIQTTQEDTALSDTEKNDIILNLQTQADALITSIPKTIAITNKITNLPATPLEDLTPEMVEDESLIDQIYSMQDKMQARTNIKVFQIQTFSGEEALKTLISKTITLPVQEGYIIEVIPLASTPDELDFQGQYETLSFSPVTLKIPFFEQAFFSYMLEGDVSDQLLEIQTGFVPQKVEFVPKIQTKCGDGICTQYLEDEITCPEDCAKKVPWLIIIIFITVITIVILFFHFFRDKLSFIKLPGFKKDNLFPSKTDKINLKNYVKESLKENVTVEKIKAILLSKEWTKEQVDYIFNELEQEAKTEEKPEEAKEEKKETPEEAKKDESLEI